jgi:hypothetical protein
MRLGTRAASNMSDTLALLPRPHDWDASTNKHALRVKKALRRDCRLFFAVFKKDWFVRRGMVLSLLHSFDAANQTGPFIQPQGGSYDRRTVVEDSLDKVLRRPARHGWLDGDRMRRP